MKKISTSGALLLLLLLFPGCPLPEIQQVSDPVLDPAACELASVPAEIKFSSATEGAVFYYTTDGSGPTENSLSGNSCTLTQAATLRVLAVKKGMKNSGIVTAEYTVFQAPCDDPALASLNPSEGLFIPAYDPEQLTYELVISSRASEITFTPISRGPGAQISLQGTELVSGEESPAFPVSDGDILTVHAVSQDGAHTRDYQLTLGVINQDSWELNIPEGPRNKESFRTASSDDGTVLAAYSLSRELSFSGDSGLSWSEYPNINDEIRYWYALDVSADGNVIAAAYDNYFVISRDKGLTWDDPAALCEYRINDIALSADGAVIYVATDSVYDDYLCMSTDTGNSWSDLDGVNSPGLDRWGAVECSSDGSIVIAGSSEMYEEGIWFSSDGGSTWTEQSDIPNKTISMSADGTKIAAADGTYVNISTDSAQTWESVTGKFANRVFYSPDGSFLLISHYHGETDDIAWTTDDGENWTEYDDIGWELVSAGINTDASKIIACSNTAWHLRVSADMCATWSDISNVGRWDWKDAAVSADGRYQAAVFNDGQGGYLYQSGDYGENWAVNNVLGYGEWTHLAISDNGEKLAVCSYRDGIIAISSDSGSSWTNSVVGPHPSTIEKWGGIDMSSDGQVILASQIYLDTHLSADGGNSWTTVTIGSQPSNPAWRAVSVSADGNTLLLAASEVWVSADKGSTWECKDDNSSWTGGELSPDGSRIILTNVYNSRLGYSDNLGDSWTTISLGSARKPVDVCFSQYGDGILAATVEGFYSTDWVASLPGDLIVSMNAGDTWTELDGPGRRKWSGIAASNDLSIICGVAVDARGIRNNH